MGARQLAHELAAPQRAHAGEQHAAFRELEHLQRAGVADQALDVVGDELLRAVRSAAAGEAVLSPTVASRLLDQVRQPAKETLSQRELEVLQLVSSGATNREVAERLFISEATVKTHLLHIYAKLGVNDRAAAVGAAFERGLLTPGGGR